MAGIMVLITIFPPLELRIPYFLSLTKNTMTSLNPPRWVVTTITALIILASLAYFLYFPLRVQDGRVSLRCCNPRLCRQIVSGSFTYNGELNTLSPSQSRAFPNKRMLLGFGVDNAFTRPNAHHAGIFVQEARQRIKLAQSEWKDLSIYVQEIVKHWMRDRQEEPDPNRQLSEGERGTRVNLADLIQVLSIRIAIETVFDLDPEQNTRDEDILNLAKAINRTWIETKQEDADGHGITTFEENHFLQESLNAVFRAPDKEAENPLNWILPSFETLWRIVLRAFVEIRFMSGIERPEWRSIMTAFAKTPSRTQFELRPVQDELGGLFKNHSRSSTLSTCPSAKDIVMECLRLYPPTRRVYRAHRGHSNPGIESDYTLVAADIEACHLEPDIWGPDSESFNPYRWLMLTHEQKEAFMPFGSRPFECPARSVFGPRLIGILVGSLLTALESEPANIRKGWRLECANEHVMKTLATKERLNTDRDAYQDLYLVEF